MPKVKHLNSSEAFTSMKGRDLACATGENSSYSLSLVLLILESATRADQHRLRSGRDNAEDSAALCNLKQVLSLVLIQLWIKGGQWRPQSPSSLNGLDESPQRTPLQLITIRDREFRCEAMFLSALHGSFCAFLKAGSREPCVNTAGGEDEASRYTRRESELHAFDYHSQTHLERNSIISVCLFTWCLNWLVGTRFTLPLLHFSSLAIIRSTLFCLWNGNCPRIIPIMMS